jgi:glycosyltransferase involved in cell wall biosynthesis
MANYRLCIVKPNKSSYSETFINAHIDRLKGDIRVLYGGAFPVYDENHQFLIKSKKGLLIYLLQKRLFKKLEIPVRTKALADYLKTKKIEVVLAEYGYVGAMICEACKLAAVPLIIHFHGADAHHRETVDKYKALYKNAFKYAEAIVVVSNDMLNSVLSLGADREKIVLNPYGVNTEMFTPVNVLKSEPNFLAIGRFVDKKSPLSTVNAFNETVKKVPEARLWMVGDGPLLIEAKQLSQKLKLSNNITFTGVLNASEILSLMQSMRCFVQHSVTASDGDMEGTPNTILEASAAGLPIVSTRHAGIKEAVIEGETGFLVEEHDYRSMAARMIELAESPQLASTLGQNGRQHIIQNYNITQQIAKLDMLIARTVSNIKSPE